MYLNAIKLIDDKGENIVFQRWYHAHARWETLDIPDGEEIIGFYANTKSHP